MAKDLFIARAIKRHKLKLPGARDQSDSEDDDDASGLSLNASEQLEEKRREQMVLSLLYLATMRDEGSHNPVYADNLSYKALLVLEHMLTLSADEKLEPRKIKIYDMVSGVLQFLLGTISRRLKRAEGSQTVDAREELLLMQVPMD